MFTPGHPYYFEKRHAIVEATLRAGRHTHQVLGGVHIGSCRLTGSLRRGFSLGSFGLIGRWNLSPPRGGPCQASRLAITKSASEGGPCKASRPCLQRGPCYWIRYLFQAGPKPVITKPGPKAPAITGVGPPDVETSTNAASSSTTNADAAGV